MKKREKQVEAARSDLSSGIPNSEGGPQVDSATKKPRQKHGVRLMQAQVVNSVKRPMTPSELHAWLRRELEIQVPRLPLLPSSCAPFDYLCHSYFEGLLPGQAEEMRASPDCVVWANRGGGKTFLGAVATVLDMIFKPGIEVRIIGGSLEQSSRMYDYLRALLERPKLKYLVDGRATAKEVWLTNESRAQVLAQSERAVRGTRVQKVRCDEVDLFDREVWEAAQLTTRSMPSDDKAPWGKWVRGSVEAFSTMHKPMGLMWEIAGDAERQSREEESQRGMPGIECRAVRIGEGGRKELELWRPRGRKLFRWGVVDSLGHCEPERACATCVLERECGGRAKARSPEEAGHLRVDDAIEQKTRVSLATWDAEMLCLRPTRKDAVLPEFDPKVHVVEEAVSRELAAVSQAGSRAASGSRLTAQGSQLLCGMDFGYRAATVVLWARVDAFGVVTVIDERVVSWALLEEHIQAIQNSPHGVPDWIGVDPAGRQSNQQSGASNIVMMERAGLVIKSRAFGVNEGLSLIRTRLAPAAAAVIGQMANGPRAKSEGAGAGNVQGQEGIEASGIEASSTGVAPPRLFVAKRCKELIAALIKYHYDPEKPHSLEPVKDGSDHAVDALRYLIVNLDRPYRSERGKYA